MTTTETATNRKHLRGFASLSRERCSEIARLGGIAAHRSVRAHKWNSEQAAEAGRIGGRISKRKSKKHDA